MHDQATSEADPERPLYCPRCGEPWPGVGPLCGGCGEALRPRGYCPTCEAFWKLDPGVDCPKHDLELLDAPPRSEFPANAGPLVRVATFPDSNLANPARIRLEAEGIPTFLENERIANEGYYRLAAGGVRLLVPESLASAARIVMSQNWSPPADPDEELEYAWEDLEPDPWVRRWSVVKAAVLLVVLGPAVLALLMMLVDYLKK